MRSKFLKPLLASCLLAAALVAGVVEFNDTNPLGGVQIDVGPNAIAERARQQADSLGFDQTGLTPSVDMDLRREILSPVYARFGLAKGDELLRTRVPGYQWRVTWEKTGGTGLATGDEGSSRSSPRQSA